ncbi:expressed unknown protein [Seminavis robusta]|uniref:Uncharacterized protein n=1 Tax=Seminavis robusta TaxID=568900 RepID=A0A9N8EP58_9STRA|nr:expressed unknown protein [Seminavis robusta]|eukprot:Sro1571_g283330.1 n/a (936) ;mRNA; r:5894-8817
MSNRRRSARPGFSEFAQLPSHQSHQSHQSGGGGGDDFRDFMKSQRHLRARHRQAAAHPHHHQSGLFSVQEDALLEEGAPRRRSSGVAFSNHNPPPLPGGAGAGGRRRRNVRRETMVALEVLGQRHHESSEDWQNFLHSNHHHLDSHHHHDDHDGDQDSQDDDVETFAGAGHHSASMALGSTTNHTAKDKHHDDHHHHDHHHSSMILPWYCPPVQRQLWDDDQVLPHVNWHDLFFDLIFVAAAYNLGYQLTTGMDSDQWPRAVVYFVGIFGPLYKIWENDVMYASRYTLVDYSHRLVAVARFLCVSFVVLSIKPLKLLGDPRSAETFCLTLSLFCESLLQLGLNIELFLYGDGDRKSIQNQTLRETISQVLPMSLTYLGAAVVAGIGLFDAPPEKDYSSSNGGSYEPLTSPSTSSYNNETTNSYNSNQTEAGYGDDNNNYRFLAGYDDYKDKPDGVNWSLADLPLVLCLTVYVFELLVTLLQKGTHNKKIHDIREYFVPNNIDYMIHRYGEWIMLMIGESILSLLIVETTEHQDYYIIMALGCLTVIILQILHYESEPSHADGHALWRSMTAAALYSILIQILSMSLITFGVSYKLMLKDVVYEDKSSYDSASSASASANYDDGSGGQRRLAGDPISANAVAWMFSISLCAILVVLEMMLVTHRGIRETCQLLFRGGNNKNNDERGSSLNWPLIFVGVLKLGLIVFAATLPFYIEKPVHVAIFGFVIVCSMALIRILGWGFVHHEEHMLNAMSSLTYGAVGNSEPTEESEQQPTPPTTAVARAITYAPAAEAEEKAPTKISTNGVAPNNKPPPPTRPPPPRPRPPPPPRPPSRTRRPHVPNNKRDPPGVCKSSDSVCATTEHSSSAHNSNYYRASSKPRPTTRSATNGRAPTTRAPKGNSTRTLPVNAMRNDRTAKTSRTASKPTTKALVPKSTNY